MFITDLRRKVIIKRDFSTFGYKFYLENKDYDIPNQSALTLHLLLEADIRKVSHGFFVFIEVQVDVDFTYNEFFPKLEQGTKLVFIFDYEKLVSFYTTEYIEEALSKVKNQNILICLDNFKPNDNHLTDKMLSYVSFFMLDINSDIKDYDKYINMGIQPIYKNINSQEHLEKALKQDVVELLIGDYIEVPKKLSIKLASKPSSLITELFIELKSPSDINKAIEIIKRSPELTFSILKFINSAFFAVPNKVSSVESAVGLLGFNNLRKWVNLLFLSSVTPNAAENVYVEKSVIRASFMERVSRFLDRKDQNRSSTAYITGLLSMLDIMLDSPFEEIFKDIPVAQDVYDALVKHNNFFAELLDFVKTFEFDDKEKQKYYAQKFGLEEHFGGRVYFEAIYEYDRFKQAVS